MQGVDNFICHSDLGSDPYFSYEKMLCHVSCKYLLESYMGVGSLHFGKKTRLTSTNMIDTHIKARL